MSNYPEQFPAQPQQPMQQPGPVRRPGTVTAACAMTWIFSTIALVLAVLFAFAALVSRDEVVDQIEQDENFRDLDVSADSFVGALTGASVAIAVLSLLAIVFAVMAFRGSSVGRVLLVLCAVVGAVLALLLSLALIPFLWVIACVTSIVLLFVGGAGDFFRAKRHA